MDSLRRFALSRELEILQDLAQYALTTKGGPVAGFVGDLWRGKTFNNEDPLSWKSLAKRPGPFTVQAVVSDWQRGMPGKQLAIGGPLEGLGLKTSPMSTSDYTQEFSRKLYDGKKYLELEPYQKDIIRSLIEEEREAGRIAQRHPPDGYWRQLESINDRRDESIKGLVEILTDPRKAGSLEVYQLRDIYYNAKNIARISKEQAALDFGQEFQEADPDEEDPLKTAMHDYYDLYDKATHNNNFIQPLFNRLLDELVAGFTPEQREYYYRNTNMRHVPKAIFKILSKEAQKRIMLSIRARAKHSLQGITSRDMRELTAEWAQERPEGQSQWDVAVWGMTKKMGFDQMTAEMVASGLYTQKRKE